MKKDFQRTLRGWFGELGLDFRDPLGSLTRRIYIEYNIQKSKEGDKPGRNQIVTTLSDTGCVLASGCNISMFHTIETDEKRFSTDFQGEFW